MQVEMKRKETVKEKRKIKVGCRRPGGTTVRRGLYLDCIVFEIIFLEMVRLKMALLRVRVCLLLLCASTRLVEIRSGVGRTRPTGE